VYPTNCIKFSESIRRSVSTGEKREVAKVMDELTQSYLRKVYISVLIFQASASGTYRILNVVKNSASKA